MLKKIKFLKRNNEGSETKKVNKKKDKILKKEIKEKPNDNFKKDIKKEGSNAKNNEITENQVFSNKQNIIKKMSRKDLLQLLIVQRKKIDELESELNHVKEQLTSKEIMIKDAGSIAEASLKLNKVFESAQEAANQYLENVRKVRKNKETF